VLTVRKSLSTGVPKALVHPSTVGVPTVIILHRGHALDGVY